MSDTNTLPINYQFAEAIIGKLVPYGRELRQLVMED
jgi:hypothetical protein